MNRSKRGLIAKQTVKILEEGSYRARGEVIDISNSIAYSKNNTKTMAAGDLDLAICPRFSSNAMIEVTNESTFDALLRIQQDEPDSKVGCLNFASAKNPGGGFLNGSQAQEEALSRSSGLYASLITQKSAYYDRNRSHGSSLYLDLLIVSPDVPFFRNDEGALLPEPLSVTVVTAPAPNAGAVRRNEPESEKSIEDVMRNRADMVIKSLVHSEVDSIVLGAWGCGVFQNNPRVVAKAFDLLVGKNGKYAKCFQQVCFAIFDPKKNTENYEVFRDYKFG